MTESQIMSAVDECVERCKGSRSWIVCVAEYVLRLKDIHRWKPTEADEVGSRVVKAMQAGTMLNIQR